MKQQRAIFFIDGSNFYHSLKRANFLPMKNYKRISEKLAERRGHQWLETRFYVGRLKQEGNTSLYKEQRNLLDHLKKQDDRIKIYLGRVKKLSAGGVAQELGKWLENLPNNPNAAHIPPAIVGELKKIAQKGKHQWQEKMVDVMIATDMATMALKKELDVAYLLSADIDYLPAIKAVREAGCKAIIASPDRWAKALTQDKEEDFIPLDKKFFAELKEA